MFRLIGSGLDGLFPRSQARFIPDSVVGSITIEVGEEKETLYFLADEEDRVAQDKPIDPQMTEAIKRIRLISQQLFKKTKEQ